MGGPDLDGIGEAFSKPPLILLEEDGEMLCGP